MSALLTREEMALLELLRASLTGGEAGTADLSAEDWRRICTTAESHSVLPLIWPAAEGSAGEAMCRAAAERSTAQFYHLLILTRRITGLLNEEGIDTVVLKGPGAAWYYPVPEYRQSGDIDLLLTRPEQLEDACRILTEDGAYEEEEQHANHHRSLRTPEGIVVELHSTLVEDFDDRVTNAAAARLQQSMSVNAVQREIIPCVTLPVPDESDQAISLLLHMLQHFLRAGFGLKLLCDWTVFWNNRPDDTDMGRYEAFITECGLIGFADMLGSACVLFLGLRPDMVRIEESFSDEQCREFYREVFDSECFGHTSAQRMVMVHGGPVGYVREFHHQMRLNYPKAGRWIPLWPALWGATLARFLRNNRVIRKTSLADILGETQRRSRLTGPLHLFEHKARKDIAKQDA